MVQDRSSQLQVWIDQLKAGDLAARDALVENACRRIRQLTTQMLAVDRIRHWEETDDILQEAVLDLHKSLETARPMNVREFLRLSAFHIRRTLVRLSRRYFGPHGDGTHYRPLSENSRAGGDLLRTLLDDSTPSDKASRAEQWLCVQAAVGELPDDEREVTELIWFHGLTHSEVAPLLNVSKVTVRRRWVRARTRLHKALEHLQSGSGGML